MKAFKFASMLFLIIALTMGTVNAEESHSWYIIKNGCSTPGFPEDADFISAHGGYYLDVKAAQDGEKKIYLTFDAGYENGNIEKILDILKDENIKGSFFILNNLIKKNPELVKRMGDEGHLVCNHTANHKDMTTLTKDEMLSNLARLESSYTECTGRELSKMFRFPEGKYNREVILTCEEAGYTPVFWSMAYNDWDNENQLSASVATQKLLSITHNGAIVLLHPTARTNVEILPHLIKEWREMGYEFCLLDELKG